MVHVLEMQFAEAAPVAGPLNPAAQLSPLARCGKTGNVAGMKPVFAAILLGLLGACANPDENPRANKGPSDAEIKQRDDFAKSLPKPVDR
jgi:hypothetical protein